MKQKLQEFYVKSSSDRNKHQQKKEKNLINCLHISYLYWYLSFGSFILGS